MEKTPFSNVLEKWHNTKQVKTVSTFIEVFAEKSFAIIIMFLLSFSALPIPTGGITNIFEIVAMLLCLELMIGRRTIWLPKKWQKLKISGGKHDKVIPALAKRIRWFEKFSRPRLSGLMNDRKFLKVIGLVLFVLSFAAFLAPPFSGLDTLPSLAVVIICLSLILEDAALLGAGLIVGGIGITIEVGIGRALIGVMKELF